MAAVALSDQLGAMAVVDGMRHRLMRVVDHINVDERAEEARKRILDYYAQHNIVVDDDLVGRGVAEYFDKRLTYEEPRLNWLARAAAHCYVTRGVWTRKAAKWGMQLAAATVLVYGAIQGIDYWQHSSLMATADSLGDARTQWTDSLSKEEARLKTLRTHAATFDEQGQKAVAMADRAIGLLSEARQHVAATPTPDLIRQAEASTAKGLVATAESRFRAAKGNLTEAKSLATSAESLIAQLRTIRQLTTDVADTTARFALMPLTEDEKALVRVYQEAFAGHARSLDGKAATAAAKDLGALLAYAESSLNVVIVDRPSVRSGVERTHNVSGGKSWYLVVEAVDAAGISRSVPVTNRETGVKGFARTFAVRVSQDEYNRTKLDKQADGHVDERAMGVKPTGSFNIAFNGRVSDNAEIITEW